jgi:hypothetical protein
MKQIVLKLTAPLQAQRGRIVSRQIVANDLRTFP